MAWDVLETQFYNFYTPSAIALALKRFIELYIY